MRRRKWIFRLLLVVFLLTLPTVIFYTTGYRLSFDNDETSIITTGGIYIDTDTTEVEVYLNEEQYMRPRLFQSAYYLQNISAGQQRVVVQAPGVHTWVKELPVDAHIVTEATAFNVPVISQLRPITPYQLADAAVYIVATTTNATSSILGTATATTPILITTELATTSYSTNPEFDFVAALFASSSSSTVSVFTEVETGPRFSFATSPVSTSTSTTTATTTVELIEQGDMQLIDRDQDLYALWNGTPYTIPYYFCVSSSSKASTTERYGEHVSDTVFSTLGTTTATSTVFDLDGRHCRSEIKLDRLRQDVYLYDFMPGTADRVLLHLQEGLYVTEIDDRSWQNTQPLLLGADFLVLVENDVIYISRNGYYFELVPTLDT